MPSDRVFSSRLGTTGVAEFRLEIRQGFGLVSIGGRPIWTSPNLRSRVSELHPDMPRVSTRKSRDCFLVWDLSCEADLTQARCSTQHSQTIRRAEMAARQNPVLLQMAELLKGSADQKKEFSVHGRKANCFW